MTTFSRFGMALIAAACLSGTAAKADTLSDNLSATVAGTETATGDTWLTSSFGTGSTTYTLSGVTLLLDSTDNGTATVQLYSDGGLQPGSLVASLTTSGTYGSSLSPVTFSSSGVSLSADSTYWVVLQALTGSIDWAWTTDNTGTGIGFQDTWGSSSDAGTTWFTDDIYPTEMSVDAAAITTAVPEPESLTLCFAGALFGLAFLKLTRKEKQ